VTGAPTPAESPLTIGIIAGESSGDQLGSRLMRALAAEAGTAIRFVGVGGPLMTEAGLASLFPMSDIAVNGVLPVLRRLPLLLRRMGDAARGIAAERPDIVVHVDAQDFNQRVARRLKRLLPDTPLVCYVSPTVWAWRSGRARKIARIYSSLMAVLPFEPEVHLRLGGPPTTYVGHPLMERLGDITPNAAETRTRQKEPYRLLLLPGSRHGEISRLLPVFGEAVQALHARFPGLQVQLPAVAHLRAEIEGLIAAWPVKPALLDGEEAKLAAFRTARAALAASGTVTLELALAGVPTVAAYKVSYIEGEIARRLIKVKFATLPNLILGRKLLPEFIDWDWTGETLADAVSAILADGPARDAQIEGFEEVRRLMAEGVDTPSRTAARIVLAATTTMT
jgi:lipid-A-disaccharide synthase